MTLSLKQCDTCRVEGYFNADEVRCHECGDLLIPLSLIPTETLTKKLSENATLRAERDEAVRLLEELVLLTGFSTKRINEIIAKVKP